MTDSLQSLNDSVISAVNAQNTLTQTVANKMGQIDQTVQQEINKLEDWRVSAIKRLPIVNTLLDSGRFFDPYDTQNAQQMRNILLTAPFANTQIALFASTATSVGKFIHDNSTNGGASGVLTQPVIDLLQAMGAPNKRYGTEFYICEITAGGVSFYPNRVDGYELYLSSTFGSDETGLLTFMRWVRCISGVIYADSTYKNGVATAPHVLLPNDGWVHLSIATEWGSGYSSCGIYSIPNSIYQIAMPACILGDYSGIVHISPLLGFD